MLLPYDCQAKKVENICHKHIYSEGKAKWMVIRLLVSAANFGTCCPGDLEGNNSENIIPTTLSMAPVVQ